MPFGIRSAGSFLPPTSAAIASASMNRMQSPARTYERPIRPRSSDGDDPRRLVVDVDRRDPERRRAPMYGSVPLHAPRWSWVAGLGVVAGTDHRARASRSRSGAPAAIRCSATSWAPNFVSSYQLQEPLAEVAPVRLVDDPAAGVAEHVDRRDVDDPRRRRRPRRHRGSASSCRRWRPTSRRARPS